MNETQRTFAFSVCVLLIAVTATICFSSESFARGGKLKIRTVDADTGKPVAVRMHLKDPRGRPVQPRRVPFWKDHFAVDGEITLRLPQGAYTFEIERGPEYKDYRGNFQIRPNADDIKVIQMHRFVDLSSEGWWSGELHVHRSVEDIELLMRAEDLHVAPVITWWRGKTRWDKPRGTRGVVQFDGDRYYSDTAGEDERDGGALLYFGLEEPLDLSEAQPEYPSSGRFLVQAKRREGVHVDIEKPFWWDVPMWLASRRVDSMGVLNNHLWRDGVLDNEAWGKPRDRLFFPPPHGVGRWSEAIYYHVLNCGLQIPPSAGSASGVLPNPVGYNRVYVYCGENFSYERWWDGLRAGRVLVTNGPLLRAFVDGHPPGHVFPGRAGDEFAFEIGLKLSTREKVEYLEIIKNGESLHQVRLDMFAKAGGKLPKVPFEESGWFLVRAVTNNDKTYRLASTGPYYVVFDGEPRISRESAQFFLDWTRERMRNIDLDDAGKRVSVLRYHRAAEQYWAEVLEKANAD